MTTGPGMVERVEVIALTVVVVTLLVVDVADVEVLVELEDVVPAARVRSWLPPPPQAARATRARAVNGGRPLLVSLYGPACDARAATGRDIRPAAGDRPSGRGRGLRRFLPLG